MRSRYQLPSKNQARLEYVTTADMADGQPLPPYFEGTPWRIVMRAGGHTVWSRPSISNTPVPAWRTALGVHHPRLNRAEGNQQ